MIPDHDPDRVICNGYPSGPRFEPFVLDWQQWGSAVHFLATRIKARELIDGEPILGLVGGDIAGSILAETLAARLRKPVLDHFALATRMVFCSGAYRGTSNPLFPRMIDSCVVVHEFPPPRGVQWYFALAPGRKVVWPWESH